MATNDSSGLIILGKSKNETKEEQSFEKKLIAIFHEEYEETIEDILILTQETFLNQIKNGVQLTLEENYPEINLSDEKIQKLISQNMDEIHKQYNHDYTLISKEWTSYNKISKRRTCTDNLLKNYRKHCLLSENFASHNCCPIKEVGKPNQSCHFICVYNNDIKHKIIFVVCEFCKKVYYSNYIIALCNKCNVEYYTSLLSPEENPDMLLATWENYHCPQLINEKMKCIQCREFIYLNMKNGFLTCLNKNCGFVIKPSRILWTCIVCKTEFKSGVKPYNPLEYVFAKKLVEQTILLKQKSHPIKLPCCKLNVFFTDFYHKKSCKGKLYQSEFNERIIIVCEKCQGINFIDRFKWTCPKCGKKFIDKGNENNLNDKKIIKFNNNNEKNNEYNNDNDNKKEGYFTPRLSQYKKRRYKSQIGDELDKSDKFNLNEITNKDIDNKNSKAFKEPPNSNETNNKNENTEKISSPRVRKFRKSNGNIENSNNEKEQNLLKSFNNKEIISRNRNSELVRKYNTNVGSYRRYTNYKKNEGNKEKKGINVQKIPLINKEIKSKEKETKKEEEKEKEKEDIDVEIEEKHYPKSPSPKNKKFSFNFTDKNWFFKFL